MTLNTDQKVAKLEDDRLIGKDILAIADLIKNRQFIVKLNS